MKELLESYFKDLAESFGRGWNRFWYTPASVLPLGVLRILVGLAAVYYLASFNGDLIRWFGKDGILPMSVVQKLREGYPDLSQFVPFYILNFTDDSTELWAIHWTCLAITVAFTLGIFTRVTSVLTFCAVLSYVHRAPMLAGQFEPILTMLVFYFCFAPAGKCLSIDSWFRNRGATATGTAGSTHAPMEKSWTANVCLRLMQVHLAVFYGVMALTKLGGVFEMPFEAPWWRGLSVWWLIAHTESRLVDLTSLHSVPLLLNAWTYGIVAFEILFPVLIWNRLARPFLLVIAVPLWCSLALITGLVSFCLLMLIGNLVFVSPSVFEVVCGRYRPRAAVA